MPLGASITYGVSSSDGNGYRSHLRSLLRRNGVAAVNMVGSRRAGTMRDADNEGWPGATVDQVRDHALKSQLDANAEGGDPRRGDGIARWAPNVVLINAGANDCIQNIDIEHVVTTRVRTLLFDAVWRLSPRAAVVLSTLVPLHDGAAESRALRYNADAAALVRELQAAGRRIVLADMRAGPDRLTADDITGDGVHPNDGGYAKMARVWMAAIQDADRRGFLVAPDPVEGLVDNGGDD